MRRFLSILAIAGCTIASLPAISFAQSLPGLTIFSGVERDYQLSFRLDFNGRPNGWDRYHLRISDEKMELAAEQFVITYPDTYRGTFDPEEIEVRVDDEAVPLSEVNWDEENRVIEIFPETPVPAGEDVDIVLSNVRNPMNGGTHYFNALVRSPGDVPLLRYLGTWIISIGNS